MKNNLTYSILLILFLTGVSYIFYLNQKNTRINKSSLYPYSFYVAGHAYGVPGHDDYFLYSKFYDQIVEFEKNEEVRFGVYTGDFVRDGNSADNWFTVSNQLEKLNKETYLVFGNHDYSKYGISYFEAHYGGTYYSERIGEDLFIFLDTQKERANITHDQIEYVTNLLGDISQRSRVFIFMHELLWSTDYNKYTGFTTTNNGSYRGILETNFYEDFLPVIESMDNNVYIFAGDIGVTNVISAFYEKNENIYFIASGMGGSEEENFLNVTVSSEDVTFKIIPLDKEVDIQPLELYNLQYYLPK